MSTITLCWICSITYCECKLGTFDIKKYHSILCNDYPSFLDEYISLPIMQRLSGVGLLCGTDWTPLFNNSFFYSRLDHSIGVALIVWNFTHDKKQTLSGLFHDISTPAFSHVTDFRNDDALTQESTEALTSKMINEDIDLSAKLFKDGIYKYEVDDYHKYPIADNDIPGLSADRLEYMFPSGASLCDAWTLEEIEGIYKSIKVLTNEKGLCELGFSCTESAVEYVRKFCDISMILQRNEDKVSMQLMADIITRAISCGLIAENELYAMDESYIIECFDNMLKKDVDAVFKRLYKTFRGMKEIVRSDSQISKMYCVNVAVKRRYVDPLVECSNGEARRISSMDKEAHSIIESFKKYEDKPFGCVKML